VWDQSDTSKMMLKLLSECVICCFQRDHDFAGGNNHAPRRRWRRRVDNIEFDPTPLTKGRHHGQSPGALHLQQRTLSDLPHGVGTRGQSWVEPDKTPSNTLGAEANAVVPLQIFALTDEKTRFVDLHWSIKYAVELLIDWLHIEVDIQTQACIMRIYSRNYVFQSRVLPE